MPCYSPLTGYFSKELTKAGKRGIVFSRGASFSGVPMKLPCGQCIGCKLEHSRQWAIRCMHERQLHAFNEFVTLTYDDENLPKGGSLVKRDLQLFFKRLRKKYGKGVRFYACGEYGESLGRPHYHAIIFNLCLRDKKFFSKNKRGEVLYTSQSLTKVWGLGHVVTGEVTFDSAAYVARYITKKITGDAADAHYLGRLPEFTNMSRKPGIGAKWYEKYGAHAYEFDTVIMNGKEIRPPRFYDTRLSGVDSARLDKLKRKRRRKAVAFKSEQTPERRRVREIVEIQRLKQSRRSI